jgi:hypothetical protein
MKNKIKNKITFHDFISKLNCGLQASEFEGFGDETILKNTQEPNIYMYGNQKVKIEFIK